MELKSVITMEIKIDDRVYVFMMPAGAPFGEVYDVTFKMLEKVVEMAKNASEQARPKDAPLSPEIVKS